MLTVLFVLAVLFCFSKLLTILDNQAVSGDVSSYLHNEYKMPASSRLTFAQLRNI